MIIKYFESGQGSSGAVEYVTLKSDAVILKGNPKLTADLIKSNLNKYKYRSGVLSFGSDQLSKEQKLEIMELFEKSTFAGLPEDDYNILWVQHNDTDNDHIHFVIPRLNLRTGTAFNPHWHKIDQERLIMLQDYINNKYELSNPFEAERTQVLQVNKNWSNRNQAKEQINSVVIQGIEQGLISNRNELIEFLELNDIKVPKVTKKSISIKLDEYEKNIRLTGVYYGENFTSAEAITDELTRTERKHTTVTQAELERLKERLTRAITKRAEYNQRRYAKKHKEDKPSVRIIDGSSITETRRNNTQEHRLRAGEDTQGETLANANSRNDNNDIYNGYDNTRNDNYINKYRRDNILLLAKGGKINDTTRTAITDSVGELTEEEQATINTARTNGRRIYEQHQTSSRQLRENIVENENRAIQRAGEFFEHIRFRREERNRKHKASIGELRAKYRGNAEKVDINAKEYQQQRDRRVSELKKIAGDSSIRAIANKGTISSLAERLKEGVGAFVIRVQEQAKKAYRSVSKGFGLSR
jgi:hypothetical protein